MPDRGPGWPDRGAPAESTKGRQEPEKAYPPRPKRPHGPGRSFRAGQSEGLLAQGARQWRNQPSLPQRRWRHAKAHIYVIKTKGSRMKDRSRYGLERLDQFDR